MTTRRETHPEAHEAVLRMERNIDRMRSWDSTAVSYDDMVALTSYIEDLEDALAVGPDYDHLVAAIDAEEESP